MSESSENTAEETTKSSGTPRVMLMGVGKGGIAIASEIAPPEVEFQRVFVDTSRSDLDNIAIPGSRKILLGENALHGFGAGMKAESGEAAALECRETIEALFAETDLLFLVTALGHGTGSGASPVIAKIAKDAGVMVVCFATNPFSTEGRAFTRQANEAARKLNASSNAFVVVDHELVGQTLAEPQRFDDRFKSGTEWISRGIENCCAMIFSAQIQKRIDFSSFKNIFPVTGTRTLFAIGKGSIENDGEEALKSLFECPLLESGSAAKHSDTLAIHLRLGTAPGMDFLKNIAQRIQEKFGGADRILEPFSIVPELGDKMEISVLGADGVEAAMRKQARVVSIPKYSSSGLTTPLSAADSGSDEPLFDFGNALENRLYEGIDLEKPTYLRRKINLTKELESRRRERKKHGL